MASSQRGTVGLKRTQASSGWIDSDGADESAFLDALSILEQLEAYGDIERTAMMLGGCDPDLYAAGILKRHSKKIRQN